MTAQWTSHVGVAQLNAQRVRTPTRTYLMTGKIPLLCAGELSSQHLFPALTAIASWLYRLNLAVDANFRLKRKKVSTDAVDPDLNHGCAYIVEENDYKAHLKQFDSDNPKDTEKECNTHDAVKLTNLRGATGLAATGIATVDCSRHDMKRPCSVGDLQKGER